jgi:hypothetical protein
MAMGIQFCSSEQSRTAGVTNSGREKTNFKGKSGGMSGLGQMQTYCVLSAFVCSGPAPVAP